MKIVSESSNKTKKIGENLSRFLLPSHIIGFSGELGAGKTVFISGIAKGLNIKERIVSPTFIIIKKYKGKFNLAHIDLYRLNKIEEIENLEIKELLRDEYILTIEWVEKIENLIKNYLKIIIHTTKKINKRIIEFIPCGEEYKNILKEMEKYYGNSWT
jgi:tRNA threonylcarbamoyladenosine biosynthesis protein TsaE